MRRHIGRIRQVGLHGLGRQGGRQRPKRASVRTGVLGIGKLIGLKYPTNHDRDEIMRMLGSVRLASNRRITLPDELVETLKIGEGDFILFFEDKGTVIVKMEKG